MMKKGFLMVAVILMAAGMAQAAEGELTGSIEMTYLSKFIWRGFAVYGEQGALQPAINLDLYGSGFGIQSQYSTATGSGYEMVRWLRNYLYYRGQAFSDGSCPMNYQFGYYYYNFPDNSCDTIDLQELHGIFSFPTLLGGGLVPSIAIVKLWPAHSGQLNGANNPAGGTASGWAYIPMLDYGLPITCPITGEPSTLNLHYEMVYNDGVAPVGGKVDSEWSNAVFGVSTNINLSENVTLTPAMYYQSSWEDSVNPDDEFWGGATLTIGF